MLILCVIALLGWGEYRRFEYFRNLARAQANKAEAEKAEVKGGTL